MADRVDRLPSPYRAILLSRIRSQQVYGLSFGLDLLSSLFFGLIEFAEIWILFHNINALGGLTLTQMTLLFGLAHTGYAISQLLFGHVDRMPTYLRTGTMEAFYLRPLSLLGQLITSDVALRRVGWLAVGLFALGYGLIVNPIAWSPAKVLLLVVAIGATAGIFSALFVAAAAVQFFLIDGAEATNAFTYGGRYASQQPMSIMPLPLAILFTAIIPVAFTGYLPTLALLDLPAPPELSWLAPNLAWAAPLAALGAWAVTAGLWRIGVGHYQGGGG